MTALMTLLSTSPDQLAWYPLRLSVLEAGPQTDEVRDEVEALRRHLERWAPGATPIDVKSAIAKAKREYADAVLHDAPALAAAAKSKIATLRKEEKIDREIRRAAPARAALAKAAEEAARASAAARAAEAAERQKAIDASAEVLATHLVGLWSGLAATRAEHPNTRIDVIMTHAMRIAGKRVGANTVHLLSELYSALRAGATY
jgi:hypothetical protein